MGGRPARRSSLSAESRPVGKIVEIKGVVLDAAFPGHLPRSTTRSRSRCRPATAARAAKLIAEVQQHLGDDRVRAVAMDATDGLARGSTAYDTGASISVPVGEKTLGRIFNVLGERDRQEAGRRARRRAALADPPRAAGLRRPDARRPRSSRRHQGHRPARPVRQGRQDRPLRRRRRGQDGAHPGADQQHRHAARRPLGVRRRRRAHARGQRPLARDDRSPASSTRPRSSTAR